MQAHTLSAQSGSFVTASSGIVVSRIAHNSYKRQTHATCIHKYTYYIYIYISIGISIVNIREIRKREYENKSVLKNGKGNIVACNCETLSTLEHINIIKHTHNKHKKKTRNNNNSF